MTSENKYNKNMDSLVCNIIKEHRHNLMIAESEIDYIVENTLEYKEKMLEDESNTDLFNKITDKINYRLFKEGYELQYNNEKDIYFYTKEKAIKKGYEELLQYLNNNNIDYEISNSENAGIVPSIYIKNPDNEIVARIGNHENHNINQKYKIYNNSDYIDWKNKIIKDIEKQLEY